MRPAFLESVRWPNSAACEYGVAPELSAESGSVLRSPPFVCPFVAVAMKEATQPAPGELSPSICPNEMGPGIVVLLLASVSGQYLKEAVEAAMWWYAAETPPLAVVVVVAAVPEK